MVSINSFEENIVDDYNNITVVSAITFVLFSQLVYSVFNHEMRNHADGTFIVCKSKILRIILTTTYILITNYWFDIQSRNFYLSIISLTCLFSPYLIKSSRYRSSSIGTIYRSWNDKLILTSLVYTSAGCYALYKLQLEFAFLCGVTSIGSILYHYNRESRFFNMDNIFATSLLVVFLYSLFLSYYQNEVYFQIGIPGIFTALFLFQYCGDPALITLDKLNCCYRSELPIYNLYHTLWHIASGVGPFMSIYFFDTIPDSYLKHHDRYVLLYTLALLFGVFVNTLGNYFKVIPFD